MMKAETEGPNRLAAEDNLQEAPESPPYCVLQREWDVQSG